MAGLRGIEKAGCWEGGWDYRVTAGLDQSHVQDVSILNMLLT